MSSSGSRVTDIPLGDVLCVALKKVTERKETEKDRGWGGGGLGGRVGWGAGAVFSQTEVDLRLWNIVFFTAFVLMDLMQ